ncbi:glycosyltransferase family 2 protein [Brucella tritici]|uniref:glycosyltransferase family 2 protein n=1 Tax=Brucella tritici TaxID=94626 RepID=UPI001AEEE2E5|nr:glycosyltransferase family A protein [Brucella tritici]
MAKLSGTCSTQSNQKDSVAVIIPYYNGSKYIKRSAASVLNQTVLPAEFIVVNDGSTPEETEKLIEISREMGFQVLHKENGGQGSARNFGVQHSISHFISFLDQDDFYLRTHIETLLSGVDGGDPHFGWVYADLMEADEDGNIIRSDTVVHHSVHPKRYINDLIGMDMFVLPSASLISRDAYEAVGGFDTQFTGYEDDDLFLRIYRKGYSNVFLNTSVTVWCINTDSTSYSIKMSRSRIKYIKKLCDTFPDNIVRDRLYTSNIIFPRFKNIVFAEAFRSTFKNKSHQSTMLTSHSDELIDIMNEFTELMCSKINIPRFEIIKMKILSNVISRRSGIINAILYMMYAVLIFIRNIFSNQANRK